MKRSRLRLFKNTSMMISVLGVIMVVSTIIIAGYVGFSWISSGISNSVSSGGQYDQLAVLNSDYQKLEGELTDKKSTINTDDKTKKNKLIAAELNLVRAKSAIDDVESALKSKKTEKEIEDRIKTAQTQLDTSGNSIKEL
ncbi:hypothetical protein [Methanobrevibacter filiformis]|uniref:Uncharacterized protein n=1 Tax=Methanobrevibacter filiformis TaxID=55758 RepID=A0A165ZPR6_9EURY|nr:hypothetical protein [Methanobrevibacter filiformis]KZX10999.1 hypothetical protein MBFIL_15710 [Methanobrevibacter filiformis]